MDGTSDKDRCIKEERDEKDQTMDVCEEKQGGLRQRIVELLKQLVHMCWPIICVQVCQLLLSPISLIFCGHLGDKIGFDGAALAISVINCTVISVGHGLSTACDTLFSQTIRSRNKTLVGDYLQKAVLIYTLSLLPIYALHINLESLLLLMGQHPETARIAGDYLLIFIPGCWSFYMYLTLSKYLLSMDILYPNIFISLVTNGVNAILHYVLLYKLEMGIRGSAISLTCAHVLNLILMLSYIKISGCYKETWAGWTKKCLKEWGPITRLAVSGMLMVGMEWWAFELGLILSGILGTTELGAQSVILQFDQVWYQVPLSIQIACSIRVGQWLGAGDIQRAKMVGWIALALTVAVSIIPVTLFVAIPRQLTSIFTSIPSIVELTAQLLPLVALYVTLDGLTCACKGVLTGTGRQTLSAILIFISYYVISLPIGIPLMFLTDLGVAAYWIGLTINMFVQTVFLLIILPKTDWEKQKELAFERNKNLQVLQEEQQSLTRSTSARYESKPEGTVPRNCDEQSNKNILHLKNDSSEGQFMSHRKEETKEVSIECVIEYHPKEQPFSYDHIRVKVVVAAILLLVFIFGVLIKLFLETPQPFWNHYIHADVNSTTLVDQRLEITSRIPT